MINTFTDNYRFLSNFYTVSVHSYDSWDHLVYPTLEHAFQAAKTEDIDMRLEIKRAVTPGLAKHLGRIATLRYDWEKIKRDVMLTLLRDKFNLQYSKILSRKLVATIGHDLVEGNTWHDNYWGACSCMACILDTKHNWLGKLLTHVRFENAIKLGIDIQ